MVLKGINYWPKQLSDDMFWLFEIQKTKKKTKKNSFSQNGFGGELITEQNS